MRVVPIILAGGRSTRMGRNKLLLPWRGSTVIRTVVETVLQSGLSEPVVVLGHEAELVKDALAGLPARFVPNGKYQEGMGTSIAAGVRAAAAEADTFLIMLGDMPYVTSDLIRAVCDLADTRGIVVPRTNGRPGNPVAFGREFRCGLEALSGNKGARALIHKNPSAVRFLDWPDAHAFRDMDKPEDLLDECGLV